MNLLVRAPNWVGDCVLATPFLSLLRARHPAARISVLCRPSGVEVLRGHPALDEILVQRDAWAAVRELRRRRFDAGWLLPGSFSSAWVFLAGGVRERIGYRGDGRSLLLTRAVRRPAGPEHRVITWARLADPSASRETITPASHPVARFSEPDGIDLERLLPGPAGSRAVALNPCSQFPARRWPAERYAALARRLLAERGTRVVLVGGPDPAECAIAARVVELVGVPAYEPGERGIVAAPFNAPFINLAGRTSLGELAAVLSRLRLLVTSDTGIMHVGAAAGVPLLVLAGAGDMRVTPPWTERHVIIDRQVPCSPCVRNHCPNRREPMLCMEAITVDEVFTQVMEMVGG